MPAAPYTVGFEVEVSAGASSVLALLAERGHAHSEMHPYHCDCHTCDYRHAQYLFACQRDCTADGEFISKVLDYGSERYHTAVRSIGIALCRTGATVEGGVGCHVHVQKPQTDAGKVRLMRLFVRYQEELRELAAGGFRSVRDYNSPMCAVAELYAPETLEAPQRAGYLAGGSWLDIHHGATVEFRLWNSTRMAWRIRTYVGLSVAMVRAADDGVLVTPRSWRPVERVLQPYLDADTWAGILRQRFSKGGIA